MGLFDSLKKLTKDIEKGINDSGIKDDLSKIRKCSIKWTTKYIW